MSQILGEFEQLVLLALVRLGEEAYGVNIQEEIARHAKRAASLGTVYKTLMRLEDKGLVESWAGDPSPTRGGRRKKHYRLLPAGARDLHRSLAALRGMTRGLSPRLDVR